MVNKKIQTVNIHGKEYVPVSERVRLLHDELKENISIITEVITHAPIVVIKASVTIPKGTFTGISAANPGKTIEKANPYEVAETSAVGRALGFAGYGMIDSIASADEMIHAISKEEAPKSVVNGNGRSTKKQIDFIQDLIEKKGVPETKILAKWDLTKLDELTFEQASYMINVLSKMKDKGV